MSYLIVLFTVLSDCILCIALFALYYLQYIIITSNILDDFW